MVKKKKILIIALAQSSHTHAWVDLISQKNFEVRLFGIKNSRPHQSFNNYYYCLQENFPFINQKPSRLEWFNKMRRFIFYFDYFNNYFFENWWLSRIIKKWQPDIIHTLGIDPAGFRFLDIWESIPNKKIQWVVTIRGGSDLELERFDQKKQLLFKKIFKQCSYVLADNKITYKYAFDLGLSEDKKPDWEFIPGTGGMDIAKLSRLRKNKTTQSRIILWPKACEATYSKGLPVLEAIKNVWSKIKPCQIIMTAVDSDFEKWIEAILPEEIRENIKISNRVPRQELLKTMAQSRIILLPSLVDGIPNSLYEAMATQTFPIVSPLKTIKTVIGDKNVLFARNLYPSEIAMALDKAMNDDKLVTKTIKNNLLLVSSIANRKKISQNVNKFYLNLP